MAYTKSGTHGQRKGRISGRHLAIVNEYFKNGFNKKLALAACGCGSPETNSAYWFNHPDVVAEIERRHKKLQEKYDIDYDWIVQRLALMANGFLLLAKFKKVDEAGKVYLDFTGATQSELALIDKIKINKKGEIEFSAIDSANALTALARITGIEKSKLEITGKDGGPVEIDMKELGRRLEFIARSSKED